MNAIAKNPKWVLFRVIIACVVGLVVGGLALQAGYQAIQNSEIRYTQLDTQRSLKEIAADLDKYHREKGSFPRSLELMQSVTGPGFTDIPTLDGWGHPFVYSVHGTHDLVVSYGRDGKPGGVGLDSDLSTDAPQPTGPAVTFRQFMSLPEDLDMIKTSLISGILAAILGFVIVKPVELTRRNTVLLVVKLVVTLAATIFVATIITVVHLPSGH